MSKKQIKNKKISVETPTDPKALLKLKKLKITLAIIIAAFAFILYDQSIYHNYTLDDNSVISENRITKQGIAGIPTILKTDYWYGSNQDELRGPIYRPAPLIVFAIVWQFFPNNPHAYHFINVLLYAISCLILFLVLCKLFKNQNLIFPFVCSLLYAGHPIHTEVVNNIKSLDEIFCFLFGMLSILFIFRYISTRSIVSLFLGGMSFFLALISKETGIAFLVVIPLTIFFFTDQPGKKIVRISVILIAFTAVWLLLRMIIFKDLNQKAGIANSLLNNIVNGAPDFISWQATAFYTLLRYIGLLIFPHPLSFDYSFAQIEIKNLNDPAALLGIVLYFALGTYALINIRKKSIVAFAILFYLITLAPVSNVFFIGGSTMAERFMYIPSLGFCIILTYFLIKLTKTENVKSRFNNLSKFFSVNSFLFIFVLGIIVLYSVKIFSRNKDWKDNITLFSHDVTIVKNSAKAHFILGTVLLSDVYPKEKDKVKQDSILNVIVDELSRGIEIMSAVSTFAPSYNYMLGIAYMYKKDPKSALSYLEMYRDKYAKPEIEVYNRLASVYYDLNMFDKAIQAEDSVIKYLPDFSNTYLFKGNALFAKQEYEKALVQYQKAIELSPNNVEVYYNRAIAFANEKKYEEALKDYDKTIELKPDYVEAYVNRGNILSDEKKYDEALNNFNKAIELRPGFDKSYFNRGTVYINTKKYDESIKDFTKAIELNPGYFKAYYNRGIAKFNSGNKAAACLDMQKAVELGFQPAADFIKLQCH